MIQAVRRFISNRTTRRRKTFDPHRHSETHPNPEEPDSKRLRWFFFSFLHSTHDRRRLADAPYEGRERSTYAHECTSGRHPTAVWGERFAIGDADEWTEHCDAVRTVSRHHRVRIKKKKSSSSDTRVDRRRRFVGHFALPVEDVMRKNRLRRPQNALLSGSEVLWRRGSRGTDNVNDCEAVNRFFCDANSADTRTSRERAYKTSRRNKVRRIFEKKPRQNQWHDPKFWFCRQVTHHEGLPFENLFKNLVFRKSRLFG